MTDTERQLRQFIHESYPLAGDPAGIDPSLDLMESGIIDSLGVLGLVAFLEETFGITVQDDDMLPENLGSIRAILAFVDRKTG